VASTYVHVDSHPVTLESIHRSRDNNQSLLSDKVANTPLPLGALAAPVRSQIELEGVGGSDQEQQAAEPLQR
jgi:hypothetical protein